MTSEELLDYINGAIEGRYTIVDIKDKINMFECHSIANGMLVTKTMFEDGTFNRTCREIDVRVARLRKGEVIDG